MKPLFLVWAGGTPLLRRQTAGKREGAARSGSAVAPLKRSSVSKTTLWTPTGSTHPDGPSPVTPLKLPLPCQAILPSQGKTRLINLIGERCLIQCFFDEVPVDAQASIINEEWRKTHLPHRPMRPIEELLGPGTSDYLKTKAHDQCSHQQESSFHPGLHQNEP